MSGIDFDQVVDALLDIRRRPVVLLQQERDRLRWRSDLWGEIQQSLSALRSAAELFLSKSKGLPFTANSSDTNIVRATASDSAVAGTYKVTVKQLATATRVGSGFSGYTLGVGDKVNTITLLKNLKSILSTTTTGNFTINGKQISVDPATDTLQNVIDRINNTVGIGVTASYDATNDVLVLTSPNPIALGATGDTSNFLQVAGLLGSQQTFDGTNYIRQSTFHLGRVRADVALQNDNLRVALTATTGSFKVNGVTISYDASTESLNAILSKINQQVPDVQAYYDQTTDKVVLVSKNTGSNSVSREDVSGNLLDALGLLDNGTNARAQVTLGKDAIITVEGFNNNQDIVRSSNTISDVISGVTLQLISADATKTVTVTVDRDKGKLKETIKAFVEKFNAAVSLMQQRLTENPVEEPKTDTERKQGLLRGDSTLFYARSTLVQEVTKSVSNVPSGWELLAHIGITLNNDGTLSINETKLQAKIDENPERVAQLFFNDEDNDGKVDDIEDGIAVRVDRKLDAWLSTTPVAFGGNTIPEGMVAQQPSLLNLRIRDLDRRINELNERVEREGERLRRKFIALEQQLAFLQQRLGGQLPAGTSQTADLSRFLQRTV